MTDTHIQTPFSQAVSWDRSGAATWTGELAKDWTTGRSAFGGYVMAGSVCALDALCGEDRPPRTVSASLMNAINPGPFTAEGTVLREGRNLSVAELQLRQGDTHAATVLVAFGVERQSKVSVEADTRPGIPGPDEFEARPYVEGVGPPCTQHFDIRFTDGNPIFSGSDESASAGWIRLRHAGDRADLAAVAMLDAFPFPFMQMMDAPAPLTSIMMNFHLLDLEGADPAGWWWLSSKTIHAAKGYATFTARLYRPDGKLGAWAEQLVGIYDG